METQVLKEAVRIVPDFPKPGISFLDITTLLIEPERFRAVIDGLAKLAADLEADKIIGVDARGFIFASALALELNRGLVLARKAGKLPFRTISSAYGLEYGNATVEIHADAIKPGERVLVVDDVLATGGTAAAVASLVAKLGGKVAGLLFLAEIRELNGRDKLNGAPIRALLGF